MLIVGAGRLSLTRLPEAVYYKKNEFLQQHESIKTS